MIFVICGVRTFFSGIKIVDDADVLLAFYEYPAEHWIHLRITNRIESTFATVRLRTKVTKGPGSRARGNCHGLQADRRCPGPLAGRQRGAPASPSSVPVPCSTKANCSHDPSTSRPQKPMPSQPKRRSPENTPIR